MSTTATACASPAIPEPVLTTSTSSSHFTVNYLGIAKSPDTDTDNADFVAAWRWQPLTAPCGKRMRFGQRLGEQI
jgi:hypothetical protein